MVKGHHLQLRCHPQILCDFRQFNIKATPAHHSIIQEMDELLAKDAIEPCSGKAGFYCNIFVVPKNTGGLHPMVYHNPLTITSWI